jgi:signal transduction histidine kinase
MPGRTILALWSGTLLLLVALATPAHAKILWSDPDARTVHETGIGVDILGGTVKRTDTNSDALYFRFHVDPASDWRTEYYFAGLQLFEGDKERLGVGNAMEAWAYSAFNTSDKGPSNTIAGEYDLKSAHPEPAIVGKDFRPYEVVHEGVQRTIVFKVQYVPGGDAVVTVWLNPNLGRGATEENQPENLTTTFKAKATFDQIRLRQGKGEKNPRTGEENPGTGGNGWTFSDMAIATSFNDFVVVRFWQTWWFDTMVGIAMLVGVGSTVRIVERRKFQRRLQRAEYETALQRERARIAQDLHDELGSALTRLSLLSGLVKTDKDHPDQVQAHADKLSQAADQSVRALEEIVWAVRPGSDSLQSLADYFAHFANELFEGNATRCRLDLPHDLPALPLPPDMRHNIFLIVKEALTNTLKHAKAREVQVQARASDNQLEVIVKDDGKGFDPAVLVEGRRNGLGNMRRRAESIHGTLEVQSAPGSGTTIRLSVPLENGAQNRPG